MRGGERKESSPFSPPLIARAFSRGSLRLPLEMELPRRLAVQGMWIHMGGSDVNRLRLRVKGQHVWRIVPYFNHKQLK